MPIASTSTVLSLAVLEYLVHVDPDLLDTTIVSVKINVPQSIRPKEIAIDSLPVDWRDYPAPAVLADIGDAWQKSNQSLLLSVPSAIIPEERNVLINPRHSDFALIRIAGVQRFSFDPRVLKRR